MAKNLIVNGATYNAVESIEIPLSGGGGNAVFPDTSDADAVAADIANGKTAYINAVKITGTSTGGGGILTGIVTPATNERGISVTHNFGSIPNYVYFCCFDLTSSINFTYYCCGGKPNVSHFCFAKTTSKQIEFAALAYALTGASGESNHCGICDLTTTTMTLGNTGQTKYYMGAGITYHWFMW